MYHLYLDWSLLVGFFILESDAEMYLHDFTFMLDSAYLSSYFLG
jgi:hypothetical protein